MKYTVEELLKIAKENEDVLKETPKGINDVHRFISAMKLKAGKHVVRNSIIYKTYKLWSAKPLRSKQFFIMFSQFFEPQINSNHTYRYYKLNYRSVELLNKIDNKKIKI